MGEGSAREAAAAIDRDQWARAKPGDLKAVCPKKAKFTYRIHPAIGIARVGDSPNEFFIGAETENFKGPESFCTLDTAKNTYSTQLISSTPHKARFKDKAYPGAGIRRQAARFRIYEYVFLEKDNRWAWTREIGSAEAKIKWTVEVANNKATFAEFDGPNVSSGAMRSGKNIAPKPASLEIEHTYPKKGAPQRQELKDAGAAPLDYLGEILHDDEGHLVFLGGRGKTRAGAKAIELYANNPGWGDDVCDGSIKAEITFPDAKKVHKTSDSYGDAWVMVGPPDYGPQLTNVTSLYDTMLDVAVRSLDKWDDEKHRSLWTIHDVEPRKKLDFKANFELDLLRIFEATYQVNTTFAPANPPMKHPAVYLLALQTSLDDPKETPDDIANGREPKAHVRYKVFNTLRPWDKDNVRLTTTDPQPAGALPPPKGKSPDPKKYEDRYDLYRWTMPFLWGDSSSDYLTVRNSVTQLQYRLIEQWNKGNFEDTKGTSFKQILRSGVITPGGLDRAALDRAVGGPFFPGIEASWLTRLHKVYAAPFRVKVGAQAEDFTLGAFKTSGVSGLPGEKKKVGPGFFSQQMAQPWQADFYDCARVTTGPTKNIGWWPAQRPDDVLRGEPAKQDIEGMQAYTPAQAADWTTRDFKATGAATIDKYPANITVDVRGKNANQSPTEATVEGKDEGGNAITEKIAIKRAEATFEGQKLFKKVESVSFKGGTGAPETTTLALGLGKVPDKNVDEPARIQIPTVVTVKAPSPIITFDPALLKDLKAVPRPITATVSGERAPKVITVVGKDKAGKAITDKINVPQAAGNASTTLEFSELKSITISPATPKLVDDLKLAIGIGTYGKDMVAWAAGVGDYNEMKEKWSRLGFVFDGVEIERDPTL